MVQADILYQQMKDWLSNRYGSRRGFFNTFWHKSQYLLGRYKRYINVDWSGVDRIVFVCKGNICRSAFAEAVAKSRSIESVSCGICARDGAPADPNAVAAAKKRGINLGSHRTQRVSSLTPGCNDLFVAMEPWQITYLEKLFGTSVRCTLLGFWASQRFPHIQDPFGCTSTYFDHCFCLIEQAVGGIASEIKKSGFT